MSEFPPPVPPGATGAPGAPEDPIRPAVRALIVPAHGSPAERALRTGVLRDPAAGFTGGVCAALGAAWGVPAAMIRALAVLLTLLGIGPLLYLLGLLLLPAFPPAVQPAGQPGGAGQRPDAAQPVRRGTGTTGDVLIVMAMIPAGIGALIWMLLLLTELRTLPVLVVLVLVPLVTAVAVSARRAQRARLAYLLGGLGERAGVVGPEELAAVMQEHARRAPWALASASVRPVASVPSAPEAPQSEQPDAPRLDEASSRAPRSPISLRPHLLRATALLAVGALAVAGLALLQSSASWVPDGAPLPAAWIAGGTAAAVLVTAGMLMIWAGLRGQRAVGTALVALAALPVLVLGAGWARLTFDPRAEPAIFTVDQYAPGGFVDVCGGQDASTLAQPVVVDLSGLEVPADRESAVAMWEADHAAAGGPAAPEDPAAAPDGEEPAAASDGGGAPASDGGGDAPAEFDPYASEPEPMSLHMFVYCTRPVGRVTVILPPERTPFTSDLVPAIGTVGGQAPALEHGVDPGEIGVHLTGSIAAGDVIYTRSGS